MRLKKLTISGFKAFADKVTIDFDCDVAAIVGPNGCGKSNIVDAFRWVMGEQSAKSLRGDKMHDVLFAGADHRKPLNLAEVSITLTEAGGQLPLDYEEVTLARRLHRSGESEYLINRLPVRLKDIQDLLLGSGVGKNAFSVFEQGKLDQIIHLSPLERRVIFDEAAGIGRFLLRKKESIRKLDQVSANFNRVKDIHAEVDKQTRSLKKQAAQAKAYQENKELLSHLEKALLVTKWRSISASEHLVQGKLDLASEALGKKLEEFGAAEKDLALKKGALTEKERELKNEQKRLYQVQSTLKIQEAEIRQQKERLFEFRKREESLLGEMESLSKKRSQTLETIQLKEGSLEALTLKKKELEQETEVKQKNRLEYEKRVFEHREGIKKLAQEQLISFQETGKFESLLQEKIHRLTDLSKSLQEKKERLEILEEESLLKKQVVKELSATIDQFKEKIQNVEISLSSTQSLLERKKKEQEELSQLFGAASARNLALLNLKSALEGFSKGAKQLLKEASLPKSPLFGKIQSFFDYFSPKKGFEMAVAAALRIYGDTLVVKTKKDLELVFNFAQKNGVTDFSIISADLSGLEPPFVPKEEGLATHVKAKAPFSSFLDGIRLVSNLNEALDSLPGEVVTKEGHFIDRRAVIFQIKEGQNETNAFLRESELGELAERLEKLAREQEKNAKSLSLLVEEVKDLDHERRELLEFRRKNEMTHVQENFVLQRLLADIASTRAEALSLEEQKKKLSEGDDASLSALQTQLKSKKEKQSSLLENAKHQEESLEKEEQVLLVAIQEEKHSQMNLRAHLETWSRFNQEIEIEKVKDQERSKLEDKFRREQLEVSKLIVNIHESITTKEQKNSFHNEELKGLHAVLQRLEEELKEERTKRDVIEKILTELRGHIAKLEKERHMVEIALERDVLAKKNVEKELFERQQLTLEEIEQSTFSLEESFEKTEETIRELRHALEKSGAVNMMAIEEYKSHQERFTYLDLQLSDLSVAKKDLEGIISKLEGESRKIFKETFEAINLNFQKNFSILFNGGEADLKFTQSPDVLEAGIEIIAKPPGKQMRSISLLSGGEKCLTAIALLFSIFEVRPAPFCILDEIDAPLDDSNIERFTTILQQFTHNTQFIIVTHNKKTMAIADILIGVSMEEKGVSKLVSLEFEKKALKELHDDHRHSKRN